MPICFLLYPQVKCTTEILCSKGLGGAALNKQAERKITEGFCALRVGVY